MNDGDQPKDNITPIAQQGNQQQGKNPLDVAMNKIKEQKAKDTQQKVDAQVKTTMDALNVFKKEKSKLADLLEEAEQDKATTKELLDSLK